MNVPEQLSMATLAAFGHENSMKAKSLPSGLRTVCKGCDRGIGGVMLDDVTGGDRGRGKGRGNNNDGCDNKRLHEAVMIEVVKEVEVDVEVEVEVEKEVESS